MKKLLLGTTALVAVGALAAPAQAADPISLSLGGQYFAAAGVELTDQNDAAGQPGADRRDHGFYHSSDISFSGETTTDNGVDVGVAFQLEGESNDDQVNEAYIYFEGNFGRVEFGSIDGAAFRTSVFLPSAYFFMGPNFPSVIWANNNFDGTSPFPVSFGPQTITTAFTYPGVFSFSFDNMKINYFTPRISGFQLGVSYTPEACELESRNSGVADAQECAYLGQFTLDNNLSSSFLQSEVLEIGANYYGEINNASLALSVGYLDGTVESAGAANTFEDRQEWAIHGTLGFGKFTVGAGYRDDNQGVAGPNSDTNVMAVSGSYAISDAWTLGAGFVTASAEAGAAGSEDTLDHWAIGATYMFGPGIFLMGGIENVEWEDNLNNPAGENEATTLTLGSYLSF